MTTRPFDMTDRRCFGSNCHKRVSCDWYLRPGCVPPLQPYPAGDECQYYRPRRALGPEDAEHF